MTTYPDALNDGQYARFMRDEDQREALSDELDRIRNEIVDSIMRTGSYQYGLSVIGCEEMLAEIQYHELITAALECNRNIAGRLLHDALKDAAEKVADTYAPSVFEHRNARAISDAAEDRAADRRLA